MKVQPLKVVKRLGRTTFSWCSVDGRSAGSLKPSPGSSIRHQNGGSGRTTQQYPDSSSPDDIRVRAGLRYAGLGCGKAVPWGHPSAAIARVMGQLSKYRSPTRCAASIPPPAACMLVVLARHQSGVDGDVNLAVEAPDEAGSVLGVEREASDPSTLPRSHWVCIVQCLRIPSGAWPLRGRQGDLDGYRFSTGSGPPAESPFCSPGAAVPLSGRIVAEHIRGEVAGRPLLC